MIKLPREDALCGDTTWINLHYCLIHIYKGKGLCGSANDMLHVCHSLQLFSTI